MWNRKVYNAPPDEEFKRLMKKLRDARTKTKIHHETCPKCGAKLVNLYRKSTEDSMWMCKQCWDKYDAEAAENDTPRCKTCQVQADALKSETPCVCNWYLQNVINGNKSVKSCPNYKPAEVDSNG
jgi:ribosomal protein L37AE/L43A